MTGSIRIFEKSNFTPKLSVLVFLKVKLPNMTDWHILPGLKIDVLIACCRLPVSPRKPSVVQGGHLQKFAADLSLSTPQNSRPCKIFTLSLNSNQNLHTPAPLNSRFSSQLFKISFVPFNQEIVMQHFDLYSKYSILITISDSLKFLFREPRFHPDSHSSPPSLSRLKISSNHPLISHSSPWRCRTLKY